MSKRPPAHLRDKVLPDPPGLSQNQAARPPDFRAAPMRAWLRTQESHFDRINLKSTKLTVFLNRLPIQLKLGSPIDVTLG